MGSRHVPTGGSVGWIVLACALALSACSTGSPANDAASSAPSGLESGSQATPTAASSASPAASSVASDGARPSPSASLDPSPTATTSTSQAGATIEPSRSPKPTVTASTDETADFTDGMSVALVAARARQHEATGPGEIAGPAVDLKLSIVNSTQARADVDAVTVTMAYGRERTPAVPLLSAGEPFSGGLKPGASRTATYRFLVPPGTRGNVAILVTLAADQPSVQLEGDIR